MTRAFHRAYKCLSALRHWLRRRLTPAGALTLALLVLLALLGLDAERTVAFQTASLLACALALAFAFAPFFPGKFKLARSLPRFATVDQPFSYTLTLHNLSPKLQHSLEAIEDLADTRLSLEEFSRHIRPNPASRSLRLAQPSHLRRSPPTPPIPLPPIPPSSRIEIQNHLRPVRRGSLRFQGVTLARQDPLGLFRAFIRIPQPDSIVVLPRRFPVADLCLPGTPQLQAGGVSLASRVGADDEFVALRDYRPGDPLRHVHWKSWARTGKPIVKEFEDESFTRHGLALDTFASPHSESLFEAAVSIAASIACHIQTQESLLDLMFAGPKAYCFTAGRSLGDTQQLLEVLAGVQLTPAHPFSSLEQLILQRASLLGGLVCVFLHWDAERHSLLHQLALRNIPFRAFVVVDPTLHPEQPLRPAPLHPSLVHIVRTSHIAEDLAHFRSPPSAAPPP